MGEGQGKKRLAKLWTSWRRRLFYSSPSYLRINLWHRLMEAIHTAISPINCISGPMITAGKWSIDCI